MNTRYDFPDNETYPSLFSFSVIFLRVPCTTYMAHPKPMITRHNVTPYNSHTDAALSYFLYIRFFRFLFFIIFSFFCFVRLF